MSFVASMKEAQEIYFMTNGEYSDDLTNLDLSFSLGSCARSHKPGYDDVYSCSNDVMYGVFDGITNVQAGDWNNRYLHVIADNDTWDFKKGEIYCFAKGKASIQACKALGGIEHTPCSTTVWDKCFLLP